MLYELTIIEKFRSSFYFSMCGEAIQAKKGIVHDLCFVDFAM